MALEVAVEHSKDQVRRAIMQFAARRGCKVTTPWYAECLRIEADAEMPRVANGDFDDGISGVLQAASTYLLDKPKHRAYIDVELSRKRGQTIVAISFGEHPRSSSIGAMLEAFLRDDAAYVIKTPAACPSCTAPVVNLRASFCGRCGHRLAGAAAGQDKNRGPSAEAPQDEDESIKESHGEAVVIERRREGEEPR